jgi:hypothetical protein
MKCLIDSPQGLPFTPSQREGNRKKEIEIGTTNLSNLRKSFSLNVFLRREVYVSGK